MKRITPLDSPDPIWDALNDPTNAGQVIELEEGVYPTPQYTKKAYPKELRGLGPGVRIRAGGGSTLYMADPEFCRDITFRGIVFEVGGNGDSAGVITDGKTADEAPINKRYYERLSFVDCEVDGGYDHVKGSGRASKWGMRLHQWTGGIVQNCRFHSVKFEHGLYATQGGWLDTLIDGCVFEDLGRAGIQEANRHFENDGLQAGGELRIRGCSFERCGLADGAGAITVSGREGTIWIEDITVACTRGGNALVSWGEYDPDDENYPKPGTPNDRLVLHGFDVEGNDCVRPAVQIAATRNIHLLKGRVRAGSNPVALWTEGAAFGMGGGAFPAASLEMSLTGFRIEGDWVDREKRVVLRP